MIKHAVVINFSANRSSRRQDYISLVNPSLSCLSSLGFEPEHIQWGKGGRETARMRKSTVYPPTSYSGIGRGPEGYPQSPKTFKAQSQLPHNSDSILNSLIDLVKRGLRIYKQRKLIMIQQ